MKRGIFPIIFIAAIFLISSVSGEIIIIQQPDAIYSLGDVVNVPATIKAPEDTSGILNMDLLCNGLTVNFYKNGISLQSGDEKKIDSSLVLSKDVIGSLKGMCKIKATLGQEFALTNEFEVSDLITIKLEFQKLEFSPEEFIILEGSAVKANGADADGFIELSLIESNTTKLSQIETIDNGFFKLNASIPKGMKAGGYLLKIDAYEKSLDVRTNTGIINQNIVVRQVPTSLEVLFENSTVNPGEVVKVKAVLHDQTGESITNVTSFITIKNNNDRILEQVEIATDEFFEYDIPYNAPPAQWKAVAVSSKMTTESRFSINEKESVTIKIINKTVEITNTGNVPYNKTVLVKIGEEPVNIDVYLSVDEKKEYVLSAPDGTYTVEIITPGESDSIVGEVLLTGKSIDVKQASSNIGSLVRYPIIWIFIILVLGFMAFIVYKRGYQRSFFGYVSSKIPGRNQESQAGLQPVSIAKKSIVMSRSPAQLSLSIKGDKQPVSIVSLHVKNLGSIQGKKSIVSDTLQQIVNTAESLKASTYETGSHIFFILAPTNTRTFSNEKPALDISMKARSILEEHNRKFKDKIEFGIALTGGTIVAKKIQSKQESVPVLAFMTLGNLMAASKKLSTGSKGQVLLDEKSVGKLKEYVKAKKHSHGSIQYYTIDQLKDSEEHKKFLSSFLERMEKDSKKDS